MMEKQRLIDDINRLKKEKNAIILAHNYQLPEIQDIADLTGDSLELSIKASKADADMIIFCGVSFMAETAKIVCPEKKVILPVESAGCAMADMIDAQGLQSEKVRHPGVPVVTYVNSTAAVKAESDICCTSANAVRVVESLDADTVLMTPDKNLARWVERHVDKKILFWPGYCPVHDKLTAQAVEEARSRHPEAILMAHPECPPEVIDMADVVRSTSGMLAYAAESPQGFHCGYRGGAAISTSEAESRQEILSSLSRYGVPGHEKDPSRGCPEGPGARSASYHSF